MAVAYLKEDHLSSAYFRYPCLYLNDLPICSDHFVDADVQAAFGRVSVVRSPLSLTFYDLMYLFASDSYSLSILSPETLLMRIRTPTRKACKEGKVGMFLFVGKSALKVVNSFFLLFFLELRCRKSV